MEKVAVFLEYDGFAKQGRDLFQCGFHPPFLVAGKESMYYISFVVGNDGRVFHFIGQGENEV